MDITLRKSSKIITVNEHTFMVERGDFPHAENAGMHYIYSHVNGNSSAALRMYRTQFPDRRMPNHRIFQWLHRPLRKTRLFTSPDMMLVDEELYAVQA
ncbi:hypothetical protein TNCV_3503521 [Trichonephila clavipes]|uniref:DUF4817 domain-containing protein n=1 Tax=Trichonephila clavipes TaxID=2585209 RepID=A0A8X6RXG7_TRICX|nr:hypothetical protein TNCV_3503521 [Trichonephila clavipes]